MFLLVWVEVRGEFFADAFVDFDELGGEAEEVAFDVGGEEDLAAELGEFDFFEFGVGEVFAGECVVFVDGLGGVGLRRRGVGIGG